MIYSIRILSMSNFLIKPKQKSSFASKLIKNSNTTIKPYYNELYEKNPNTTKTQNFKIHKNKLTVKNYILKKLMKISSSVPKNKFNL